MSCSSVRFCISGNNHLYVQEMSRDTDDMWTEFKDNIQYVLDGHLDSYSRVDVVEHKQIFEPKLVFDRYGKYYPCKSDFVCQIILAEAIEKGDFLPKTYAIVCYHHSSDPTDLEIVCEVGRILKELGYNLNSF